MLRGVQPPLDILLINKNILRELRIEDNSSFFNYMRMEPLMFDEILNSVSPWTRKGDTHFRKALEPGLELGRIVR